MKTYSYQILGAILFLILWEGLVSFRPNIHMLIPLPSEIPASIQKDFQSGYLFTSLISSSTHTFLGILLGSLLGIIWGLLVSEFKILENLFSLVQATLRPIPPIAWIPFTIVAFGSGANSAVFIVLIGVFWITFITTLNASKSVDPTLLELAKVYRFNNRFLLLKTIIIPASLPGIMGGIRAGLGQGWSLVVAAELLGAPGMGQRMWEAAGTLSNDIVLLYMLLIAMVFTLSDQVFMFFNRRLFRWRHL